MKFVDWVECVDNVEKHISEDTMSKLRKNDTNLKARPARFIPLATKIKR